MQMFLMNLEAVSLILLILNTFYTDNKTMSNKHRTSFQILVLACFDSVKNLMSKILIFASAFLSLLFVCHLTILYDEEKL